MAVLSATHKTKFTEASMGTVGLNDCLNDFVVRIPKTQSKVNDKLNFEKLNFRL